MRFKTAKYLKKELNILLIPILIGVAFIEVLIFFEVDTNKVGANSLVIQNSELEIPQHLIIQSNSFLPISNFAKNEFLDELAANGEKLIRTVTFYYPVSWQTDDTPCISASGINICEATIKICASNEFPFGTKLLIDGEVCEVQDRMNSRYTYRIDLFFKDKESAANWGKRTLEVIRLN